MLLRCCVCVLVVVAVVVLLIVFVAVVVVRGGGRRREGGGGGGGGPGCGDLKTKTPQHNVGNKLGQFQAFLSFFVSKKTGIVIE